MGIYVLAVLAVDHLAVDFVEIEAVFPGTSTQPTGMKVCDICATAGLSGFLASDVPFYFLTTDPDRPDLAHSARRTSNL